MNDVERFTEGDCWILMKRLHRVTSWPMYALWEYASPDFYLDPIVTQRDGRWITATGHGFVRRPDGMFLDVTGLFTEKAALAKYADRNTEGVMEFAMREFRWAVPEFGHYSYQRARVIAQRLLDIYGAPWYV